jgi:flagellar biosynthesis chaperone FliJ
VVEKLKERHNEAYRVEQFQLEQKAADEVANVRSALRDPAEIAAVENG